MRCFVHFLIISGYFLTGICFAQYTSPYTASILVDTRSESALAEGVQQALQEVLVKVTGHSSVNDSELIKKSLPNAKQWMEQYAYAETEDKKYILSVTFNPKQVNQLLHDAKQPIWNAERPLIIAWIAVAQKEGSRQLIMSDNMDQLSQVIQSAAEKRALPVMLPLADLQGINAVSVDDVWIPRPLNIQKASQRYHGDAIVIAKVTENSGAKKLRWTAEWMLWAQGARIDGENQADTLEQVLVDGVNGMANALSDRFAEQVSNESDEHLMLAVYGVSDLEKYSSISNYLTHLKAITDLQVDAISADQVIFKLLIQGGEGALTEALSKDHILSPIDFYNQQHQLAAHLNYQLVGVEAQQTG
jgi:uncharacterized protein